MQIFELYYMCLAANSSKELLYLVKKYEWHFKKLKPVCQEQLREMYKSYRKKESEVGLNGEKNKC